MEVLGSKNKPGNHNLRVKFVLEEGTNATHNDEKVSAGYPLQRYYPLQQSDNENAPDYRRDLKALVAAALNIGKDEHVPSLKECVVEGLLIDKPVKLKVKLVDDEEFGLTNDNTFQVTLYPSGRITMVYDNVDRYRSPLSMLIPADRR